MRLLPSVFSIVIFVGASGLADQSPVGEWLVPDGYSNGRGKVRIESCGGALWGLVSGEIALRQDSNNPDPALRRRPTLGIPVLLDMRAKQAESGGDKTVRWDGRFYNSRNGMTYESSIKLLTPNLLKLETCEPGGIFCGGQQWDRVWEPSAIDDTLESRAPKAPISKSRLSAPTAPVATSSIAAGDVCSRLFHLPGRAQ